MYTLATQLTVQILQWVDKNRAYCQNWKSKKIALHDACLFSGGSISLEQEFFSHLVLREVKLRYFYSISLTGHSFEALWAMIMNSTSFESQKSYLFALNWKNSIASLLRYRNLTQTNPIYVVLMYCRKVWMEHHCNLLKILKISENYEIKVWVKKWDNFKNWPLIKNLQFLFHPDETWRK